MASVISCSSSNQLARNTKEPAHGPRYDKRGCLFVRAAKWRESRESQVHSSIFLNYHQLLQVSRLHMKLGRLLVARRDSRKLRTKPALAQNERARMKIATFLASFLSLGIKGLKSEWDAQHGPTLVRRQDSQEDLCRAQDRKTCLHLTQHVAITQESCMCILYLAPIQTPVRCGLPGCW